MELQGPFHINSQEYSKEELILFSESMIHSLQAGLWEYNVYRFILDFFDDSISIEQKTSGTTGDPKKQVLNRNAMITSALATIKHFNLIPGNKVLLCLPAAYIAGKMMIVRSLAGGLNLLTSEPSGRPLKDLKEEVEFAAMVPLQVFECLSHGDHFENVHTLLIGGGEISPQLFDAIQDLQTTQVFESFAMTETYTHFATRRINGESTMGYFKAMEGVSIEIDNRDCLVIDFPGVSVGPLVTNDLVKLQGRDEFTWLGRIDNVIKSGGKKIVPEVLEQRIRKIIPYDCLLIGISDPRLGKKLLLVVETNKSNLHKDQWMSEMEKILKKHEVPKDIIAIKSIPRNKAMKYDRAATTILVEKSESGTF